MRALDRPAVVIDDGSGPAYRALFDELAALPHVTVLRHAVHRGDAASYATAINHLLCSGKELESVSLGGFEADARLLPWLVRFPWLLLWLRLREALPRVGPWLVLALLAGLAMVEVHGFRSAGVFAQDIWSPQGQARLIQFAAIFCAVSAAVLILVPWLFTRLAAGLLVLLTLVLLPKAVLAVGYFLLSAWCLGESARAGPVARDGPPGPASSLLLGIALYLIPMPLLVRLPIHYPAVWLTLLAIPIVLLRPRLRLPAFSALPAWPQRLAFAFLAFVFAIHWFAMLKPEAGADGLAMHLAIPADIARHHVLTFQPDRFVWAAMPMGGDFTYAIVYQLGGEMAARLLNLALFALLLALLHSAVRRHAGPGTAWLLVTLFAATPLAHLVTGELFVENLLASLLLGAFLAAGCGAFLAAAILGGAALATKLGALPFLVFLALYAAWKRPRWRTALAAAVLLIATAAPTYAIAWAKTGNPIFPFLNQKFHSPLLPPSAAIGDVRFRQPLTWHTVYDLTFRTDRYFEGQRGSFGFQYLVLAPLALAALLLVRRREVAAATLIALCAALVILRSDPNARYLYPELPLLSIPFAALLAWCAVHGRGVWRALLAFAIAAALLDTWFLPSSSYWHKDLYGPFTDAQRQQYLPGTAPIRAVIAWFERVHPGAPVLLTQDTAIAGLSGPVYENQWHQYNTEQQIRSAPDAAALRALLEGWGVRYAIARRARIGVAIRPRTLSDLIGQCGTPEFALDEFYVSRLEPGCTPSAPPPGTAQPEIVVPRGRYDDFNPAILFRGDWERSADFAEAVDHTTSYTDAPGAEISFAFEGTELTWIFARAPNRGIARVTIDGTAHGDFDLYGAAPEWRQQLTFGALAAGRHLAVIHVTGGHRPASGGAFVDLDAFDVK